ncbi:unnamed protein product [Urochloa decumbens]|uniref:Aminotransferase-like plant mobile domain-containing protein n=1 Tax=Urochloa decumbens TaxID=240449 RepID=A0ABC9FN91_9POAL
MVNHPRYPLLDVFYDEQHRGRKLQEHVAEVLIPLRIRTHTPLAWDERYAPFLHLAGFLPVALLVKDGLPKMDNAALTALVDRWRPETHTFHLPSGEMTVTLEDVAMLFGLPIDGQAVTGKIDADGWRDRVEMLLGVRPADPPEDAKDRKTTGVHSGWFSQHFNVPPPVGADDVVVERYARAWLWHLVGGFLFPDSSGNTISWMWLPIIGQEWDNIANYSWGTAALGWLYRQMCDGYRRSGGNANLGGCAYLLQLWMWEHIPVGRPERYAHGALPSYEGSSAATVGYLWHNILNVHGNPGRRYLDYSNALDCLSHRPVTWRPYNRGEVENMHLAPICRRDEEYWRSVCPLICFYIVEHHLPCRVMSQFGCLQSYPPEHYDTNKELHGTDHRKQRGAKDWKLKHQGHVNAWNARAGTRMYGGALHRDGPFMLYLDWLKQNARLKLKIALDSQYIEDLPSDPEDVFDEYDDLTRRGTHPQRDPLEDYIGQQLGRFANESRQALSVPIGDPDKASLLRSFMQRFHRGCRKMAYKLNCMAAPDVAERDFATPSGSASGSASRSRSTATGTVTRSPPSATSRRRGKEVARQDSPPSDESDDPESSADSEDIDPSYGQEEIGASQLPDAPSPTQGSPRPKRRARAPDRTDLVSGNLLPTEPGRARRTKKPYTPNPSCGKGKGKGKGRK